MMRSRIALLLSSLLFLASLVWVAMTADDQLPAHFTADGTVDRTESKTSFLVTMGGIGFALILMFGSARWWIGRIPGHLVNMPSAQAHAYWTSPERRPEFDRKISEDLEWIGGATTLLLTWMVVVAGLTTGDSLSAWVFALPTGVFMASVFGYVIYVIKGSRYRVPKGR